MKTFSTVAEAEANGYTVWDELKCADAYLYRKRLLGFGWVYAMVPYRYY